LVIAIGFADQSGKGCRARFIDSRSAALVFMG
jgi:hypothetical protein